MDTCIHGHEWLDTHNTCPVCELEQILSSAEELLWEFQNNPNIELGEIGHAKIDNYFANKERNKLIHGEE